MGLAVPELIPHGWIDRRTRNAPAAGHLGRPRCL